MKIIFIDKNKEEEIKKAELLKVWQEIDDQQCAASYWAVNLCRVYIQMMLDGQVFDKDGKPEKKQLK